MLDTGLYSFIPDCGTAVAWFLSFRLYILNQIIRAMCILEIFDDEGQLTYKVFGGNSYF